MEKQKGNIYRIEEDLDDQGKEDWMEVWAESGLKEIADFLGKHAAFGAFLEKADDDSSDSEQLVNE